MSQRVQDTDDELFSAVMANSHHVLHDILPDRTSHPYTLRLRNIAIPFGIEKLEQCDYPTMVTVSIKYRRVTDGPTDTRTDRRTSCNSTVRAMKSITR